MRLLLHPFVRYNNKELQLEKELLRQNNLFPCLFPCLLNNSKCKILAPVIKITEFYVISLHFTGSH